MGIYWFKVNNENDIGLAYSSLWAYMLKSIKNKFWEELMIHAFLKLHQSKRGGQQKLKTSNYII
jgi:hypothetical protein